MENSYGIGITNRYALFLDDESDPLETIKLKEQAKEAKKKNKVAEKENKGKQETQVPIKGKTNPVVKKVVRDAVNKPQEKRDEPRSNLKSNYEGKLERPFNKSTTENREERNNRKNRDGFPAFNEPRSDFRKDRDDRPRKENPDNFENRNRGDRNNERNNRGLNNKLGNVPRNGKRFDDRRGKREFDRQSGSDKTGVKHIDKRDGSGSHNWGSHKDVIEEADNKPIDTENNWGESETSNTVTDSPNKEEPLEPEAPAVEEPKELTLDEWKAQRAGRSKPTYNSRKAGEGEDLSHWKKMYELKKKEDDEQESEEEEFDASEYPQRVGRQKHLLDIDIQFNDPRRPGIGRGKGPRPGGTRGKNPRGERPERRVREDYGGERVGENRRAPKVDDERDFPSLG